jgi:hypothetical protein
MNIRRIASLADIILGVWLLVSSIFWTTTTAHAHAASAGLVGASSVALGIAALGGRDWCRWIVAGLAVWLFFSVWVLPGGTATMVANHLLTATLLFGFSALPTGRGRASGAYPL